MQLKKTFCVIVLVVVFIGAFLWLKNEWGSTVVGDEIKYSVELSDLKKGEEYQFGEIPWGASLKEVKAIVPYSLQWRVSGETNVYKAEQHLFMGKSTSVTFEFKDDKIYEVELAYAAGHRVKKIQKIINEVTEVLGPVSEIKGPLNEYPGYEQLYYIWQTDSTMLQICFDTSNNIVYRVIITIRSKEY